MQMKKRKRKIHFLRRILRFSSELVAPVPNNPKFSIPTVEENIEQVDCSMETSLGPSCLMPDFGKKRKLDECYQNGPNKRFKDLIEEEHSYARLGSSNTHFSPTEVPSIDSEYRDTCEDYNLNVEPSDSLLNRRCSICECDMLYPNFRRLLRNRHSQLFSQCEAYNPEFGKIDSVLHYKNDKNQAFGAQDITHTTCVGKSPICDDRSLNEPRRSESS